MPDLRNSLSRMDFNQLKIVAEKWRLPLTAPDAREGVNQLIDHLLDIGTLQEILETLTTPEKEALLWLDSLDGKEPWPHFIRRFGEVREMGAGWVDRERPDKDPISPAEGLWYRALVTRGFFDTDSGPLEFAYIPEDIRGLLMIVLNPGNSSQSRKFVCRKAVPRERKHLLPASDICLDHTCTLLSGWRMNLDPDVHLPGISQNEVDFYRTLFSTMTLLAENGTPAPEKIRNFFDKLLGERFFMLWQFWRTSDTHQDLSLTPDIQIEGILELDPCRVRELLISLLKDLDPKTWWSIESFVSQVKEKYPDFQRTGGEYDSWYIKSKSTGEYLRGFNHWEDVEGELLKYLLAGPMHWLGLLDLGLIEEDGQPASFRFSAYASDLFNMKVPSIAVRNPEAVQIRSKGEIRMTMNVTHKIRYQVSRFCEWYPVKAEAYLYAISPASLSRAEKQGLRVAHLLSLLMNNAEAIPPNILAALERWEKQGVQSSVAQKTILRLGSPAVLKSLKKSKASRYILEQIGPTVVIIREGSEDKIAEVLVELGFFLELED